ncbi:dGTPase [Kushneria sinocarnis]|uniref:dGTPase n=1 Tax=Kushneria sinocarnis TaxID=595502 RepID=A0A420WZF9_9GAMM|nr:dNTP triphosphohydrolase [Kushneria sinocarnis]RKR06723.1 dGTPase [Kushneria sinocarnis]
MASYDWSKLLNNKRRRSMEASNESDIWSTPRTEIERDYDRVVFSAATRRLANKTQVFPMDENDSVRTRLTHSNEVSNLARGAGVMLSNKKFLTDHVCRDRLIRDLPSVLAAVGLVHDMGNPPFGHQGEQAIRDWFESKLNSDELSGRCLDAKFNDFRRFDGNAQTFRLVNRLHAADGEYGVDLTVATLASMIKYPVFNSTKNSNYTKAGVFVSEEEIARQVWEESGLEEGVRHPLTYIMEACDDIAYATIDAEDTIKKGYASFNDLKRWLDDKEIKNSFNDIYNKIDKKINYFAAQQKLTNEVRDEVSVEIFRALAINQFLNAAVEQFSNDMENLGGGYLESRESGYYEIVEEFHLKKEIKAMKDFTKHYGFGNHDVLELELSGRIYIQGVMDFVWEGIKDLDEGLSSSSHYNKFILSKISRNYLREFKRAYSEAGEDRAEKNYARFQLLVDYVSGMTENYLQRTYNEIKPFYEKCSLR